jgi:hypothetical protein
MALSPRRRRMAHAALRLYPRWWRERYGDEVSDLVDTTGVTRREVATLFASAIGERLRSDPRLDASGAGVIRRFGVAVVLAYIAAVSMMLLASMAWAAVSAVAHFYLWTVYDRFEPTFAAYLAQGWEFGWRAVLLAIPAYLGFSVSFALPIVGALTFTPLGARWPAASKVAAVIGFLTFSIWLLTPVHAVLLAPAAWCFAMVMFPARRPDLPSVPARVGDPS